MNHTQVQTRPDIADLLVPKGGKGLLTRWTTWLVAAAVVVGAVAAAERLMRGSAAADAPQFVTEAVSRGDLDVTVSATGKLQPTITVSVGSELSGLVDAVFVDENEAVKKGQVLARLDVLRLQDQITGSAATLAAAEARVDRPRRP